MLIDPAEWQLVARYIFPIYVQRCHLMFYPGNNGKKCWRKDTRDEKLWQKQLGFGIG